ncbi:MAG: glycosyltransferase family 4 protein [Pseudomonadota bacterium]
MKIFFYAPFKPVGHHRPSGDLTTASELCEHLAARGHELVQASRLRLRWVYWKPHLWPAAAAERLRLLGTAQREKPDLWLTFHCYYKAPDIIGPWVSARAGLPYLIFKGIYSTKVRRRLKTLPGFLLNRRALTSAAGIISNRREDMVNLARIIPAERLYYTPPGIKPADFAFRPEARERLRREWGVGDSPVVLTAAMFRPDVKTKGLIHAIRACGKLLARGRDLFLAVAGDGEERKKIERIAARELGGRVRFAGLVPRDKMADFYSAGDLFAFPGFNEALGMVYLEAQSCGRPVVACPEGGVPEVVEHGRGGLFAPADDLDAFAGAVARFLDDPGFRESQGNLARARILADHDLGKNYLLLDEILKKAARGQK